MDLGFQERMRAIVERILAGRKTPGAAAAVIIDGEVVFSEGVGFRTLERTLPTRAGDQFYVYSATKMLIAAIILQLEEQGRLALDDPFQAYLPGISLETPVTVRQLLNNTGGIPDYGALPEYAAQIRADPRHSWTSAEFLENTLARGLAFEPGQGWQYSNPGFMLLRMVIEAVLGDPFREAVEQRIAAPCGLRQTFVAETLEDARVLAPGYSDFFHPNGPLEDIHEIYHPGWVSHGVVISTADELARAVDGIFAGSLIGSESRAAMLAAVPVNASHPLFRQPSYGLGVMVDPRSPYGLMAGHGGGGPGYSAGVLHLPRGNGRRITAAALCNCDQEDLGLRIAFDLLLAAAGKPED